VDLATAIQQLQSVIRRPELGLKPEDVEALQTVLAAHAPPAKTEDAALQVLVEAARVFGRKTPRRHPSGAYGRALGNLVDAAHRASAMDELAWAAEVAQLREEVTRLTEDRGSVPSP
jgi:hypothetical protein